GRGGRTRGAGGVLGAGNKAASRSRRLRMSLSRALSSRTTRSMLSASSRACRSSRTLWRPGSRTGAGYNCRTMTEQKDRVESPTARGLDKRALKYTASIAYDRRLYRHDIAGSTAHARMLAKQGIIAGDDAESILRGLEEIRDEIERGNFPYREELEDIHLNVESRLQEKIGEAAGRL